MLKSAANIQNKRNRMKRGRVCVNLQRGGGQLQQLFHPSSAHIHTTENFLKKALSTF